MNVAVTIGGLLVVFLVWANLDARLSSRELGCANCGDGLPPRAKRRHVPRRGGRLLPVCDACADAIDSQGTLEVQP